MRKTAEAMGWLVVIVLALALVSVSTTARAEKGSSAATVVVAKLGFSMQLPAGWVADSKDPTRFYQQGKMKTNYGKVEEYPLGGKTLDAFIKSNLSGAEIAAKNHRAVGNYDGYEVVSSVKGKGVTLELDIQKGKKVIRVFFHVPGENFPKQENAFRKAFGSIKIK